MLYKKIGQPYYLGKIPNFRLDFLYKVKPILFCAFAALVSTTTSASAQNPYVIPNNAYNMPPAYGYGSPYVAVPQAPIIAMPYQWQPQADANGTIGGIVRPSLGTLYLPMPWYTRPTVPTVGNSYTYPSAPLFGPGLFQRTR